MGRKKVKLHRIENAATRQITYTKRRDGLIKKVKEISILCDVEVGFVMISENGIGTAITGVNNDLVSLIQRYAEVNQQDRDRRARETMHMVSKTLKKQGHEVDMRRYKEQNGAREIEELFNAIHLTHARLEELSNKIRAWGNIDEIQDINLLNYLEEILMKQSEELNTRLAQGFYVAKTNIVLPNMHAPETGMNSCFRYPYLGGNPIATMTNVDQGGFMDTAEMNEYLNFSQFASSSGTQNNVDLRNFAGTTELDHFVGSEGTQYFMDPSHLAGPSGTKEHMEIREFENFLHQPMTINSTVEEALQQMNLSGVNRIITNSGQEFNSTNEFEPSNAEASFHDLFLPNANPHLDGLGRSSITGCFADAVQQGDAGDPSVKYECFINAALQSDGAETSSGNHGPESI